MLLIELATQAVKGFSPSSRMVLRPGYNVVVPPPAVAPAVVPLLSALLYNDGRGTDAMLGTSQGTARAGLTVQGRDGRTYRLIRALGGAGALHRFEPDNTWALVSQDPVQINQILESHHAKIGLSGLLHLAVVIEG